MNRSLRRWHFRIVAGLAPVAALTLAATIVARKSAPDNPIPAPLQIASAGDFHEVGRQLIRADGFSVALRRLSDLSGSRFIELHPLGDPHVADLLVYLGPSGSSAFESHSKFLGSLPGAEVTRFALPADSTGLTELFLYSGAEHMILAHVNLTGGTP